MNIDTLFLNKIIIRDIKEEELSSFLEFFVKFCWLNSKIPPGSRKVKESENPTLDKLPKGFDIKDFVVKSIKRNYFLLENIGPVYIGISARVVKARDLTFSMDIDKFFFERDDRYRSLKTFVEEALKQYQLPPEGVGLKENKKEKTAPKRGRPKKKVTK